MSNDYHKGKLIKTSVRPQDFDMDLRGLYGWMRLITTILGLRLATGLALSIVVLAAFDLSSIGIYRMTQMLLFFILSGVALFLIYKRNIKFRMIIVAELIIRATLIIVSISIHEATESWMAFIFLRPIFSILGIIYLYKSSRVRNTFVYPRMQFTDKGAPAGRPKAVNYAIGELMQIRTMRISDYDSVYALWSGTNGVGLRTLDDSRQGIERFLSRNPSTNFVAQSGGQIVGVILCGSDGRRAYIYHAAVAENHRKQGTGSKLFEAVKNAAKDIGIHKIALVVFSDNIQGNAFWERRGFTLRGDLSYRDLSINDNNKYKGDNYERDGDHKHY